MARALVLGYFQILAKLRRQRQHFGQHDWLLNLFSSHKKDVHISGNVTLMTQFRIYICLVSMTATCPRPYAWLLIRTKTIVSHRLLDTAKFPDISLLIKYVYVVLSFLKIRNSYSVAPCIS